MGVMITYHGYNNPTYNAHINEGVHYTQQNMVVLIWKVEPSIHDNGWSHGYGVCRGRVKIRIKGNAKAFGLSTGRIGFHLLRKEIVGKKQVWKEKEK